MSSPSPDQGIPNRGDIEVTDVLRELKDVEQAVSDQEEKDAVRRVRRMLEHVPGTKQIEKYTSRDMGEAFIGGLVFSLPLLVEDGVFDIAAWFASTWIGPIPVFFTLNVLLIIAITTGLLYVVDFREIAIKHPLFGFIPKRLIGILTISFVCAFGMMLLWGRLHEPVNGTDPTTLESLARATIIWTSAALGAVLADVLPGESKGEDLRELIRQ